MANDPYKYFRIEAQELVEALTHGVLDLEKGHGDAESLARLLRYAHTLKGAARVVKQPRIAELSHSMEEILARSRDNPRSIGPDQIRQLLAHVDGISAELATLNPPAAAPAEAQLTDQTPGAEPVDERFETVRVGVQDMDALLRTVSELRVQMSGLSRQARGLRQTARVANELAVAPEARTVEQLAEALKDIQRTVSAILDRSDRELGELYEQAVAMRLVPADSVFGLLERTARDAAESTGKQVVFESSGGEIRLDARGLRLLRDALVQLVRNAVTHGVEAPAQRAAAGKPQAGRVQIAVERRGDRAIFICVDDGNGIDVARVRQVVLERKLVTPAQAEQLTPTDATALLLRGGITTSRHVSQLAGRGIGLDVVRETVSALHGSVTAQTQPGKGTRIELSVPVQVESQEVLHVQAGDCVVSLPRQGVTQVIRVTADDVAQSPEGQSILCGNQAVRFVPLASLMQRQGSPLPPALSALVLESSSGIAAIGVEHVLGVERVVSRSLPDVLGDMTTIGGAFLDSEGNPQLVLSVDGLVQAVLSGSGVGVETAVAHRPPLLVIDDSLTTRMLEQGILESAGYEVDTASSGEEALEMARHRRYGAFVVDVEMPGMDGFTFIQTARSEPDLSAVPAIVVTSRDSAEDRARGDRAGAKAYIVKSAFDEELLLKIIGKLVGSPAGRQVEP